MLPQLLLPLCISRLSPNQTFKGRSNWERQQHRRQTLSQWGSSWVLFWTPDQCSFPSMKCLRQQQMSVQKRESHNRSEDMWTLPRINLDHRRNMCLGAINSFLNLWFVEQDRRGWVFFLKKKQKNDAMAAVYGRDGDTRMLPHVYPFEGCLLKRCMAISGQPRMQGTDTLFRKSPHLADSHLHAVSRSRDQSGSLSTPE